MTLLPQAAKASKWMIKIKNSLCRNKMMNPEWKSKGVTVTLVITEMFIESHYSVRDECQRWGTMEVVYVSNKEE